MFWIAFCGYTMLKQIYLLSIKVIWLWGILFFTSAWFNLTVSRYLYLSFRNRLACIYPFLWCTCLTYLKHIIGIYCNRKECETRWCQTSLTGRLVPWPEVILCVILSESLSKVFFKSTDFAFNRGLGQRRQIYNQRKQLFQGEQCSGLSIVELVYRITSLPGGSWLQRNSRIQMLSAVLWCWQAEHRAVVTAG